MPKYEIEIPGKGVFEVESPTDLTDTQAYQAVLGRLGSMPTPKKGLLAAGERGARSLLGSLQTGFESLLPQENAAANAAIKGVERQEQLAQEIEAPASLEKVKEAYRKKGLLSAAGEVASQIPGAIVEQVPQLGAMVAGAKVGRMAGPWGAVIGAAAVPLAQFYGSFMQRTAQEQIAKGEPVSIDRGKAALAAVPAAALDIVQQRLLFGSKLFSTALGIPQATLAKQSAAQVEKLAQEKLLPTLLKGTAKGVAAEIPTEIGQQMIERAQAGLSLTSPDALAEYGETAYQVGLLGPLGAVGRISDKGAARAEVAGREAADAAILADQQNQVQPPVASTRPVPPTLPGAPTQASLFEAAGPQAPFTPPTTEGFDPNLLPQLRQQYDTIERELDRLAQQFQTEQDPAKKQTIALQAQKLDYARQELEGQLKGAPARPGVAPVEGQAELDFTAPLPKDRLQAEPTIIGEQKTTPNTEAAQLELLKQRRNAGLALTPAEQFMLRETEKAEQAELQARPTPELIIPTEVGAGARPTSFVVDDKAINTFGFSKAAKKIKDAIRGLDLMKPEDKAKFDDLIAKHEYKPGAKIDMQAVEDFKAAIPQPVSAREVPEAAGLPAREYTPRQQYQQAREAMFAFGQEAAPISPRDRAILAKQQYEAENGPIPEVGAGTSEPSVSVPSGELQPTEGVGAPAATGLAGAEPVVRRPVAGKGTAGKAQPSALDPFAQMVQQVAPKGKAKLKAEETPRVKAEEDLNDFLKRIEDSVKLEGDLKGKATIELADRITQGDLKGALQEIATSKQFTPLDNLVAKRLLQAKTLPKVEIVSPEVTGGYPAQYDPNTDTVQITAGNIDSHTVLHETVHGFLHVMIRQSEAREAKGLGGNTRLNSLKDVYKHVKTKRPDLINKYGMKDLSEFASEVMSNPDFQNDLRNTPYRRSNVFTEFARAVLRAIGISPDKSGIADIDSLAGALMAAEGALSTGRKMQEDVQGGVRQQADLDIAKQDEGAFKRWFGDSKVVNEDGSPMRVYHGTPSFEGTSFKPSEAINNAGNVGGYYFTEYIGEAEGFAETSKEKAIGQALGYTPSENYTSRMMNFGEGSQIIPVYLSIKNPFTAGSKITPEMVRVFSEELMKTTPKPDYVKEKTALFKEKAESGRFAAPGIFPNITFSAEAKKKVLQAGGYDGFNDGRHWVAFEPTQIKSAIGNIGTYDPNIADIARLERTPQGSQAEADMLAFGGKAEPKEQSFIDKQKAKFNASKAKWQESYELNNDWVSATFGKMQNIASFDQAFNNRLYNHFTNLKKQGVMTMQQVESALIRISISQAVHRGNLANQIIDRGNYEYDAVTNRWNSVEDPVNMKAFEGLIRSLATKLGVDPNRARQIMGAAYEANRLQSMYQDLDTATKELAQAETDLKTIKDPKLKATKKKLIDALKDDVESLTDKVQHKNPAQVEAGMRLYNSHPEIQEGTKVWNTMRERVVKMLVETGVKTEKQAEAWLDEAAYVPFFRDMEEEKAIGPQIMSRGMRESMKDYGMKGSMRDVNDPIENMYQWMQWSIARAISNKQLQVMLDSYRDALPSEVRDGKGVNGKTFSIYRDGVQKFYNVDDAAVAQAFMGLEPVVFPAIKYFATTSNFLRHAVTRMPLFPVVQIFNDSYNAMFVSGLKNPFGLLKEIAKEVVATTRGTSETRNTLIKAGILETQDYNALNEAEAIGQRLNLNEPGAWVKLARNLDRFSSASDNVIRQGIYNQSRKEGLSHEAAMEKAAEVVNFRRISSNETMQLLSRIVPFFNAYTQVASVAVKTLTGRGISPQERDVATKTLIATTTKIMLLSMLYSMAVGDDEDYQKKNRVSRDRMFMIPGSGGFGIPIRMDMFAIPKLAGEYGYQLMSDSMFTDSKMFREAMSRAIRGSIMPPSEGVPQLVRPALGVMMNYDAFQDREIINATMRRLDPDRQYTKTTSEMAKALGAMTGMSPLNIDFLLRGYLGSVATLTSLATNDAINAVRGGPPRPDQSIGNIISSLPNMGAMMSKEENTAVLTDFYEVARDVNKAVDTLSSMKYASPEAKKAYTEEHKKELALKGQVQTINKQLTMLRRREQMIREAPEEKMSAEQKQAELKRIDEMRSRMTQNIMKIRQKLYE
jgi:hypothetical protein